MKVGIPSPFPATNTAGNVSLPTALFSFTVDRSEAIAPDTPTLVAVVSHVTFA